VFRAGEVPEHDGRIEVRVRGTGHLTSEELVALVRDEVPAHLALRLVVLGGGDGEQAVADLGDGGDGSAADETTADDATKELP
jgi:hypothetical protein